MFTVHRTRLGSATIMSAVLVFGLVGAAAADTGGEGDVDLGLESISVDSVGVNRDGSAVVRGSVECSLDIEHFGISANVQQNVGRFRVIDGWGDTDAACSAGGAAEFEILVIPYGKFAPGNAWVRADAGLCIETEEFFGCDFVSYGPTLHRLGGR